MHDVQVRGHSGRELPESVLASISAYYARVTTAARPMNRLIAAVMLATLVAVIVDIAGGGVLVWAGWPAVARAGRAVGVAAGRTGPSSVGLGTRADPPAVQSRLAR